MPAAPGASGRVGERRDAYGAGAAAADLDAVRNELGAGHVELYAAGDGARIALAYAARFGDRLRALVLDGGPGATLFGGDGRAEAHGLGKALGSGEPIVARLAARLRTRPLRVHGRIDDDALARAVVRADARSLVELHAAATAALAGDGAPLARLVARTAALPGREAAQARVSNCHDNAPPAADCRRGRRPVHRADLAARTRPRGLQGLATARDAGSRRASGCRAERCSRARARGRARRRRADCDPPEGRGPAALGHLRARARSGRARPR